MGTYEMEKIPLMMTSSVINILKVRHFLNSALPISISTILEINWWNTTNIVCCYDLGNQVEKEEVQKDASVCP